MQLDPCLRTVYRGPITNFVLRMASQPEALGIVLLDEIEKAGQDVIHSLYQVIDKGEWTNKRLVGGARAQTYTLPCHNLVFIFTTNAADNIITDFDDARDVATVGLDGVDNLCSEIECLVRSSLQYRYPFTEAFMGRVGRVVPFFHLADGDLKEDVIRGEAMTVAKLLIEREQEKLVNDGQFGVTQRMTAATKHNMASIIVRRAIRDAGVRSIQSLVETEMGNRMMHNLLLERNGLKHGARVSYSARVEESKIDFRVEDGGRRSNEGMHDWETDGDIYS